MKWFVLLVGVVVVCFVVALVLGLIGGGMGAATSSLSHEPLPDDELHDSDLDELRFDVGLRGYRMTQVDGVVDRLRRELRERDEQIAVLLDDPGPVPLRGVTEPTSDEPTAHEPNPHELTPDETDAVEPAEVRAGAVGSVESTEAQPVEMAERKPADEQAEQPQHSEPTV